LQKKKADIEKKEQEIKVQIFSEIQKCMEATNALDIDFDIIIGGIMDVLQTARSDAQKAEVWKQAGQKFCKRGKRKKTAGTKGEGATGKAQKNESHHK